MSDVRHTLELSVLRWIGRTVQELLDTVRRDTIPERWTDLLERLNAEEDAQNQRGQWSR